jgi:tetratricopeptide (TPR) repeat protein
MQDPALDPQALPREPEARITLARELKEKAGASFRRGELKEATLIASDALMLFPNEREFLDLLDDIVLSTEDPLALFPAVGPQVHVATFAARSRVYMMQRRLPEALELVCAAIRTAPEIAYLDWVRRWLLPQIVPTLQWDVLVGTAVRTALELTIDVPVDTAPADPRLVNVRAAAEIFAILRGHFSAEAALYVGEAMARRRLGDPKAAVAVGELGVARFPRDWSARIALANALGDAGRCDEAIAHVREALALRPDELSPLFDGAVAFSRAGRHGEAAALFEELCAQDPGYPTARAHLHHARWKAHGSDEDRIALLTLRDRAAWDRGLAALADEVEAPVPYQTVLPDPGDVTAASARQLLGEIAAIVEACGPGAQTGVTLTAQYLESPSVAVGFARAVRALGATGALTLEAEELPEPDPRQDKTQLGYRVWGYDGWGAQPVYPEGDPQVQGLVAVLAAQLFRRDIWDEHARLAAAQLRLLEEALESGHALVSVLAHPPEVPPDLGFDGLTWVFRCQVATALIASHVGPWPAEPARSVLTSMLYGPSDWVTAAAIIALGFRAQGDPTLRPEIEVMFEWMKTQVPEKGFTAWEIVLAECWLALGGHAETTLEGIIAWRDAYWRTREQKNRVRLVARCYGGVTLEEYAQFCLDRHNLLGDIGYAGPGAAVAALDGGNLPPALGELCESYGVPLVHPQTGVLHPFVAEWQEALRAEPELAEQFAKVQHSLDILAHSASPQELSLSMSAEVQSSELSVSTPQPVPAAAQMAAEQPSFVAEPPPVAPANEEAIEDEYTEARVDVNRLIEEAQSGIVPSEILEPPQESLRQEVTADAPSHPVLQDQAAPAWQPALFEPPDRDANPLVFPGEAVAFLADYCAILKRIMRGDVRGALGAYGLDASAYGGVTRAWVGKLVEDPQLTAKFTRMMQS